MNIEANTYVGMKGLYQLQVCAGRGSVTWWIAHSSYLQTLQFVEPVQIGIPEPDLEGGGDKGRGEESANSPL